MRAPAVWPGHAAARSDGASAGSRRRRFLFYCNEMVGLGHLRRTLAIVDCLAHAREDVTALVITGWAGAVSSSGRRGTTQPR
jgi:predicted glycosyltransferase